MGFAGAVAHQLMVRFDGEAHDPLHVDVSVCNRRDMRQMSSWVLGGIGVNFVLHGGGIPGQHDIGEQGEGAADGGRIILGSAMFGLDSPGQQRALQGMERFTLGKQPVNLAAEFGIDEIVEHEHAARDLADQGAAFIDRIPARGAAMALNDGRGGTISGV